MEKKLLGLISLVMVSGLAPAQAATFPYSGSIVLCTTTCNSFDVLDAGTTISGFLGVDVQANGEFDESDVGTIALEVYNPAEPVSGPGDPATDNPLLLDSSESVSAFAGSSGMTNDYNYPVNGEVILEILVDPWAMNETFLVFDLATGAGQICIFYEAVGCVPGTTEIAIFEGYWQTELLPVPPAIWMLGSGLVALVGVRCRGRRSCPSRGPNSPLA